MFVTSGTVHRQHSVEPMPGGYDTLRRTLDRSRTNGWCRLECRWKGVVLVEEVKGGRQYLGKVD